MNPLNALRKRRRPLAGQVLAMAGIVWLNMALQPCLMAAEIDMDMTVPCPHCPEPVTDDCNSANSSGCTYFDRIDYDGRGAYSKLSKKADLGVVALAALPAEHSQPARNCATGPPRDADLSHSARPINVLYCVYLN